MALSDVTGFFTGFFAQVFRLLNVPLPVLNITFWQFFCGCFVIGLSISILDRVLDLNRNRISYNSRHSRNYPRKGASDD